MLFIKEISLDLDPEQEQSSIKARQHDASVVSPVACSPHV